MKRMLLGLLCLATLTFSLNSCKYSHTPESVARKFLISFNQMDFATAKSLSTSNTWEILDIMSEATKNIPQERKENFASQFKVDILGVKKESDSTMVVTFKTKPKRLPFNQFRMVKSVNMDGNTRWKVDISTLDLLNSEENQTPEELLNMSGDSTQTQEP